MAYLTRIISITTLSLFAAAAFAADITGQWTSEFDTQIGVQKYTYTFAVKGEELTGTAKSELGESPVQQGKVVGDQVTFVETFKFQGNDLTITYTGKIVSANEIQFTRQVAEFATESLVAKKVK